MLLDKEEEDKNLKNYLCIKVQMGSWISKVNPLDGPYLQDHSIMGVYSQKLHIDAFDLLTSNETTISQDELKISLSG